VVTYRAGGRPRPALRRVDGTLVDVEVVTAEEGLRRARELTSRWPLEADRYVTTRPLRDPNGWFARLRDTHLARLAEARPPEFSALARHNWALASAAHTRAVRLAEWYETDAALLMIAESRLHAALVTGLLTRTYFRSGADAVRRRRGRRGHAGAQRDPEGAGRGAGRPGKPVDGPLDGTFRMSRTSPIQETPTPISVPIPYVMAAANAPSASCRTPLSHHRFPVKPGDQCAPRRTARARPPRAPATGCRTEQVGEQRDQRPDREAHERGPRRDPGLGNSSGTTPSSSWACTRSSCSGSWRSASATSRASDSGSPRRVPGGDQLLSSPSG
jgi:hypothetical protein